MEVLGPSRFWSGLGLLISQFQIEYPHLTLLSFSLVSPNFTRLIFNEPPFQTTLLHLGRGSFVAGRLIDLPLGTTSSAPDPRIDLILSSNTQKNNGRTRMKGGGERTGDAGEEN